MKTCPPAGININGYCNLYNMSKAAAKSTANALSSFNRAEAAWDPTKSRDWDQYGPPSHQCLLRIKRDITSIFNQPPPGMFVVPDEKDMTVIHALITGPFDTPYEGGFFYFLVRCPPDYPIHPPRVKLMTTGGGRVRFNPNFYKNGKVCMSILGTWSGPPWSPAQTLESVLVSMQSLMTEKPYYNEPGFNEERNPGDSSRYNDIIIHETIRVAVCDMLEGVTEESRCPDAFRAVMEKSFPEFYDYYENTVKNKMNLTSQPMLDPFGESRGHFDFTSLQKRLEAIKSKLNVSKPAQSEATKRAAEGTTSDHDSESELSDYY